MTDHPSLFTLAPLPPAPKPVRVGPTGRLILDILAASPCPQSTSEIRNMLEMAEDSLRYDDSVRDSLKRLEAKGIVQHRPGKPGAGWHVWSLTDAGRKIAETEEKA